MKVMVLEYCKSGESKWHDAATLVEFERGDLVAMFWHSDKRIDIFKDVKHAKSLYGIPAHRETFRWRYE